jgi:hypothetical protein
LDFVGAECCKWSPQLQDSQGALHSIIKLEELSGGMDRMFESEEYASILKFVGYRRVGRTRQRASANQPSQMFVGDSYWRTPEQWYWKHVFGQSFDFLYCRPFTFTQQCSFAAVG